MRMHRLVCAFDHVDVYIQQSGFHARIECNYVTAFRVRRHIVFCHSHLLPNCVHSLKGKPFKINFILKYQSRLDDVMCARMVTLVSILFHLFPFE